MTNLWVGELQACNGEHDLPHSYQDVLRDLPGDVHIVCFHILHLVTHNVNQFLKKQAETRLSGCIRDKITV